MKTLIGIDFTETALRDLSERGFSYTRGEETLDQGYQRFFFPVADPGGTFAGFEIHDVSDEEIYLKTFRLRHFEPFIGEAPPSGPTANKLAHANGVDRWVSAVRIGEIRPPEMRQYFELRKRFVFCAILFECRDLQAFENLARPDRVFETGPDGAEQRTALIHLGPCCFDLLVRESRRRD